jgi:hypothetical protein
MTTHLLAIVLVVATTVIAACVSLAICVRGDDGRLQSDVPANAHRKPQHRPRLPHLRC